MWAKVVFLILYSMFAWIFVVLSFPGIFAGVIANKSLLIETSIGSSVTFQWNFTNKIAQISEFAVISLPNVSEVITLGTTSCNDIKKHGGLIIKVVANISGILDEKYQIKHGENNLFGRVSFEGNFETGLYGWKINGVKTSDVNYTFLLCIREEGEYLASIDACAMITLKESKMNDTPSLPTDPVPTPKKPKNDELSGGGIAGIVVGCIFGLVVIPIVIFLYKKGKCAKKDSNNGGHV